MKTGQISVSDRVDEIALWLNRAHGSQELIPLGDIFIMVGNTLQEMGFEPHEIAGVFSSMAGHYSGFALAETKRHRKFNESCNCDVCRTVFSRKALLDRFKVGIDRYSTRLEQTGHKT